jgi:hypothetical protein
MRLVYTTACYKAEIFYFRFRHEEIGRVMSFTESFTWEELPTTDLETGSLTMAGCIPRTQLFGKFYMQFAMTFHCIQTAIRLALLDNRPLSYNAWYPFNTAVSPTYELVNLTQVCFIWTHISLKPWKVLLHNAVYKITNCVLWRILWHDAWKSE